MKVKMLNTAYRTEVGFVIECGNLNDFSRVLKTMGTAATFKEATKSLKEKGIPFKEYKEVEV